MIKAILAKAGVVSFTRVLRVVKDALVVRSTPRLFDKEAILGHLMKNAAIVLPDEQSFVARSALVFPDSQRKTEIRNTLISSLLKNGNIDIGHIMGETRCDY